MASPPNSSHSEALHNGSDASLSLTLLPNVLFMVKIERKAVTALTNLLLRVIFDSHDEDRFFNYVETPAEISIIIDEGASKVFQNVPGVTLHPTPWRCLRVLEGAAGYSTGVVNVLAAPLALAGISIYYHSTYSTDFVLVQADRLDDALRTLLSRMNVVGEGFEAIATAKDPFAPVPNIQPATTARALLLSSASIAIGSLAASDLSSVALTFIKYLFLEQGNRFFSFSHAGGEISLVLEDSLLARFPPDVIQTYQDKWSRMSFAEGDLGFESYGIVYSVSQPLTSADMNVFYISTFSNDHVLIRKDENDRAREHLLAKEFTITAEKY